MSHTTLVNELYAATVKQSCDCFVSATKIEQASKFNDPEEECSVLVASDAIGMGLNL